MPQKYLAITADDYGPHPFINRGIIKAVQLGRITSVGVLANPYRERPHYNPDGEIEALVDIIRESGHNIGVGVHLTISSGKPVSASPDLILEDTGEFQRMRSFDFSRDKKHLKAMREEMKAQIWVVKNVLDRHGLKIDHISSHMGLHFLFRAYFYELLEALSDLKINTTVRSPLPIWKEKDLGEIFCDSVMRVEGRKRAVQLADNNVNLWGYIMGGLGYPAMNSNRKKIYENQSLLCADRFFDNVYGKPKKEEFERVLTHFPGSPEIHRGEIVVHLGEGTDHAELELHGISTAYFKHRRDELKVLEDYNFNAAATAKNIRLRPMGNLCD